MIETAITSLTIGLLATTSPCILPLYPGFLAYLAGGQRALETSRLRYFLGVAVLGGILSMQLALGAVIAALVLPISRVLSVVIPLADLSLIVLGVLLLAGVNPFMRLPQLSVPVVSNPLVNAYLYGLLYGPISLPCSGPLVVSVFALSATAASALDKLAVFGWFGLGIGLPLVILSLFSGITQRAVTRLLSTHARLFHMVSGIVLITVAVWDLTQNWSLIAAAFS